MVNNTWKTNPELNPNPKLKVPPKRELERLHLKEKMSGRTMAAHYDVSQPQIRRWFKERGIVPRTRKEAPSGKPGEGEKNHNWKGDKVGYQALHTWVRKHKGTPMVCSHCNSKKKKKYEWANISHEYKRELDDWIRLCTKCHRLFDKQ